jgi:FtsH-binding integral membrane protein
MGNASLPVKRHSQACKTHLLRPGTAAVAMLGAVLFTVSTAGWLVLRDLSRGAAGIRITLNWTLIVGFGMPLVALVLLILWLSDRLFPLQGRDNNKSLVKSTGTRRT